MKYYAPREDHTQKERILAQLAEIEAAEDVHILYACESGSRAWGFASNDSDWDVRFIYLRTMDWYLSIDLEHKRDVIEKPVSDLLDISGWDLRKALWLFRKSNPPLIEWLHSPIVYLEKQGLLERLHQLLPVYYSPRSCFYHYLHMARGNYREYLQGEIVRTKKYLYVLRPLLALRWIEKQQSIVPVPFEELLHKTMQPSGSVYEAICSLLTQKKEGHELDNGPQLPELNNFIEAELTRLTEVASRLPKPVAPVELLNELFREMRNAEGVEIQN